MASTPSAMASSMTQAGNYPSSLKKTPPKAEALENPLLARNGSSSKTPLGGEASRASIHRLPLAPVNNANADGLRQRRKGQEDNVTKSSSTMPPPPKASLTMGGGFVGAKKERHKVRGYSMNSQF